MDLLLLTTIPALLVSALLTPYVIRFSRTAGLVDAPDGHRKLHGRCVPLGGGLVLLASFLMGTAALLLLPHEYAGAFERQLGFLIGLSLASVVIVGVGLLDDLYGLRGRQKLLGQILAVTLLMPFDLVIHKVEIFGLVIEMGLLAIPFTYFWMLGAINALNLIDGADGLATTIGTVLCLALCVLGWLTGHIPEAILAMIFLGSLIGFLGYNLPPAKIFLGDAGSMLIGLVLASLAIRGSLKGPATVALAAPLAIWGILIFDVSMAILRRRLTGRSLYTTDRGHLHHVIQNRGHGHGGTVVWIGSLCFLSCTAALISVMLKNELVAIGTLVSITFVLIITRSFGHSEVALLARKVRSFASTLIPHASRKSGEAVPVSSRLQGQHDWERHWHELREFASRFDLRSIQFDINIPSIHEEYHASWTRRRVASDAQVWRLSVPLQCGKQVLGRITVVGEDVDASACLAVSDLMEGLRQFEIDVVDHFRSVVPDHRETVPGKETTQFAAAHHPTQVFEPLKDTQDERSNPELPVHTG